MGGPESTVLSHFYPYIAVCSVESVILKIRYWFSANIFSSYQVWFQRLVWLEEADISPCLMLANFYISIT